MVDERNPYQAPEAPLADRPPGAALELADRLQRFLAALLDGLIALLYTVPLMWWLGIFDYLYRRPPQAAPAVLTYGVAAIAFAIFFVVHGYLLMKYGQTIGKRTVGIRIVDLEGNVPAFWRMVALRYFAIRLLASIPLVGPMIGLVDVLFIFRDDRRCVHDLLCGTRVIKA